MNPWVRRFLKAVYFTSLTLACYLLWFQVYPHHRFLREATLCMGLCFVILCVIVFDSIKSKKTHEQKSRGPKPVH